MRSLPRSAQAYVGGVVLVGVAVCALALVQRGFSWWALIVLASLHVVGDSRRASLAPGRVSVSAGFPIAVAAILLLGPWGAALACAASCISPQSASAGEPLKRIFNGAQLAISAVLGGLAYQVLPGTGGSGFEGARFPLVLPAVLIAGLIYFVANGLFVAFIVRLTTSMSLVDLWWGMFARAAIASLGYGLLGLLIAAVWAGGTGPVAAILILGPLFVARWAFQQYADQYKAHEATVASLIRAVETKDFYTRGHSERVSKASVLIGHELGMREDRVGMLGYAGMLHDVGKMGVPTKVLQKTGALDDAEFASIKLHPTRGFEMVRGIRFLDEALEGIRHHHERLDGKGYPDGLTKDQIPEFARVIAVADAFDSMTSTRSYRGARTVDDAIAELRRWAGAQFDPTMVEALVAAVEREGWEPTITEVTGSTDAVVMATRDHDDPTFEVTGALPTQSGLAERSEWGEPAVSGGGPIL